MSSPSVCLALAGGNALGAYSAGAIEALATSGPPIDVVSGASIGAVMAAIIGGTPPEQRIARLRAFWSQAASTVAAWPVPGRGPFREWSNAAHVARAMLFGRPGLFRPRLDLLSGLLPGIRAPGSLFDSRPLLSTLDRLIDFDYLHAHGPRVVICAIDLETGEPAYFDSHRERLTAEHVRASTGLIPSFPAVQIDGRWFGDPGLVCNLPLDPVLAPLAGDRLCFAVDLFSPEGQRPTSLGESVERAQDIALSAQATRTLAAIRRERALLHQLAELRTAAGARARLADGERPGKIDVVLVRYGPPPHELGAKMLDYSAHSIEERWRAGQRDMDLALSKLAAGDAAIVDHGFRLFRAGAGSDGQSSGSGAS